VSMSKVVLFLAVILSINILLCASTKENEEKGEKKEEDNTPHLAHGLGLFGASSNDHLSLDDRKKKLGAAIDKMDKNSDGKIILEELRTKLEQVAHDDKIHDADTKYGKIKLLLNAKDINTPLKWEEFKKAKHSEVIGDSPPNKEDEEKYKAIIAKDERMWKKADKDGDGVLSKEEFKDFTYPEDAAHMKDFFMQENMLEIDTNKDGSVSLDESIKHLHPMYKKTDPKKPEFVKYDEEKFAKFDINKDGKLSLDEIKGWLLPDDHSKSGAENFIKQADENKDGVLTKAEMFKKIELFIQNHDGDHQDELKSEDHLDHKDPLHDTHSDEDHKDEHKDEHKDTHPDEDHKDEHHEDDHEDDVEEPTHEEL
jgi:Ca2+-binding EF-hand superfamily protein